MWLSIFYLVSFIGVLSIPLCLTVLTALRKQRKINEYLLDKLTECKSLYIDTLISNKRLIKKYENERNVQNTAKKS